MTDDISFTDPVDLRALVFAQALVEAQAHVGDTNEAIDPYAPDWDGTGWADTLQELERDGIPADLVAELRAHYQAALWLISRGLTGARLEGGRGA